MRSSTPRTPRYGALAALLALLLSGPTQAQAQDKKIEQAIKHRRAAFTLMSTYFSRLTQTVDGDRPYDKAGVIADTKVVALLSRLPWEGFTPGSDTGATRAKEDIWFEEDRFHALSAKLEAKTTLLAKTAESGDLQHIRRTFESVRDTCTACHKAFRKP
jgi:cytochrome c556